MTPGTAGGVTAVATGEFEGGGVRTAVGSLLVAGVGARLGVPAVSDGCQVAFVELAVELAIELAVDMAGVEVAPFPQPATRMANAPVESMASRRLVIAEPVRCFTSPL